MRTKEDILDATHRNAQRSTKPEDISLIHQLHTLETLLDIRDQLCALTTIMGSVEKIAYRAG